MRGVGGAVAHVRAGMEYGFEGQGSVQGRVAFKEGMLEVSEQQGWLAVAVGLAKWQGACIQHLWLRLIVH